MHPPTPSAHRAKPACVSRSSTQLRPVEHGQKPAYLVFHRKLALALGAPSQLVGVPKHVIECHFSKAREFILPHFRIDNRSSSRVEPPNDRALELEWCHNLDIHNRLQDYRFCLVVHLPECPNCGKPESQFA
jgi:hypothetical protein